jgi:hypothetical protein
MWGLSDFNLIEAKQNVCGHDALYSVGAGALAYTGRAELADSCASAGLEATHVFPRTVNVFESRSRSQLPC